MKKWIKQLFCRHIWGYWGTSQTLYCGKCKKTKEFIKL